MRRSLYSTLVGSAVALCTLAPQAAALDSDLTLYLWGAGISGTATLGQATLPPQPVDVDFDDVLDNLNAGFQAHYEGTGERWGAGLDFTYIKLSNSKDSGAHGEVKATLSEAFGIYRASEIFDLLLGVRFTGMDLTFSSPGNRDAEGERSLTDFYGGARIKAPLTDSWRVALRGDVGAGDSDLVYNVVAALDWQVANAMSLRGGYRWLDYEVSKDDAKVDESMDVRMEGPFLGVAFQW